jgi:pimeloyl-ACP methyl ester carboxylesterase
VERWDCKHVRKECADGGLEKATKMMSEVRRCEQWAFYPEGQANGNPAQVEERARSQQLHSLIMIHGLQESGEIWREVCRLLKSDFCPCCLELPWSGRGGHSWGSVRPAAEWLHLGLASAPVRPQVFVAHSFGVNVVLEYLQRYEVPDLRALVLISPFYHACPKDLSWTLFYRTLHNFREIMKLGIQIRLGREKKTDPIILEAMVDKVVDYIGPLGFTEIFSLVARTPFLQLQRILVPTLVIGGTSDPASTPQCASDLARGMPDGRLELIPSCNHFSILEQPETVSGLIQRFLAPVGMTEI